MVRNKIWIGIGVVSAALMATVVAGCGTQNSNPDNSSTIPAPAGNTTTSAPQTNSSGNTRADDNISGTHPNSSGNNMPGNHKSDNNMPGKSMGDNMGGTGKPTDPGKHPGPNGTPMQGHGMNGDR